MMFKDLPIKEFKEALLEVDRIKAEKIIKKCFLEYKSFKVLESLTIVTLEDIGSGWENGEYSLSQVYMSGIICEDLIENYIEKIDVNIKSDLKIGIGVLLDNHALGKRIVHSILRVSGYDVIDFGEGLRVNKIIEKTIEEKLDVLIISTLMLSSALKVKSLVQKLRERDSNVKIIAGGAPFRLDKNLWKKVGVNADGKSGSDVPRIIEKITKGGKNEFNGESIGSS